MFAPLSLLFQRDFLKSLKTYAEFMEENNVEFGILLCSELFDNSSEGITYKEAKEYSNVLDVIELDRRRDGDSDDGAQDDNINHHDPIGYDELLQAIRAVVWSNVDLRRASSGTVLRSDANESHDVQPSQSNGAGNSSSVQAGGSSNGANPANEEADDAKLEADLAKFEQLLTEVAMFKDTTANWSRNERLAYAEKFACTYGNDELMIKYYLI